jgi:ABC-type multidrug transport system fused ATPase/permease subunit
MSQLPQEKYLADAAVKPKESWPDEGFLEFDKVCMRYRPGLPLALNQLSFCIPAGRSCGIVGRTGAGKSSIAAALFRLVELDSGSIRLDGLDLGQLDLKEVRGRRNGMAVIPQDPFLSGGTVRQCLDPFQRSSDDEIAEALKAVRLTSFDFENGAGLDSRVEEGGSNFSVGERQLLTLARALLSQPRVLLLDEATASVDGETDAFIQLMLRTRFPRTTLITIAHRLHTVMDYDVILVMKNGKAEEFGSPADLLQNPSGALSELVESTGAESARALRIMASSTRKKR